MKPAQLALYTINQNECLAKAVWKAGAVFGRTLFIVNDDGALVGILPWKAVPKYYTLGEERIDSLLVRDYCATKFNAIKVGEDPHLHGCKIFADNPQQTVIPIVDENGILRDLFFRYQAFYKEYLFGTPCPWEHLSLPLPRIHYGRLMWGAASEAEALGYDAISVVEFGVAMGHGLITCETHAKEIERFFNIKIEVYGFDTGVGLPISGDYKDLPYIFQEGDYSMDSEALLSRLERAKLILGDLRETGPLFFDEYNPAPIGVMLVDVDYYSSTVPVLEMLFADDRYFLPRVGMYFDDIECGTRYTGEWAAINEFNDRSDQNKICVTSSQNSNKLWECHRFNHSQYNQYIHNEKPTVALDR